MSEELDVLRRHEKGLMARVASLEAQVELLLTAVGSLTSAVAELGKEREEPNALELGDGERELEK